jgi:peptidyl-prolyl cis-trans isomerase SurA
MNFPSIVRQIACGTMALAATICFWAPSVQAQDPVLFTIGGDQVSVSEFRYIYEKNNGTNADYSQKSLDEYLTLYANFKLKVKKAKELGFDRDETLRRELDGYRKQLSASYLTDREIVEKLVKEAYQRSKRDVHISHILVKLSANANEEEEQQAIETLRKIKAQATSANFAELARQHSQDGNAAKDGGDQGWFNVLELPYEMETAVYSIGEGQITEPVKTNFGYHIVLVQGFRPAKGQVQVAQVLVRTKPGEEPLNQAAAAKIQEIHRQLVGGAKFEDLVAQYSEDNTSKPKEGNLGWFGINRYDATFESQAFGLAKDGDYSQPFQTSAGWHILKRIKALTNPTYEQAKPELTSRVKKNPRYEQVRKSLIERIKKESGYQLDPTARETFLKSLSDDFFNAQWKAGDVQDPDRMLFKVGDRVVTFLEFAQFCERSPMERTQARVGNAAALGNALDKVLEKMVGQVCLEYEERQLDKKYPEYRALMREYEEGILLFEATKKLVWDKAAADTVGLKQFYEGNKKRYTWANRAKVTTYTINSSDQDLVAEIRAFAKKKSPADVMAKFNTNGRVVEIQEGNFEEGKNPLLKDLAFKRGAMSAPIIKDGATVFYKVEAVTKATVKTLAEARGYVVADYQDQLERQWVQELRKMYTVNINQDVLKGLVKKQ